MSQTIEAPIRNRILAALPADDYERIREHLTPITITSGQNIYDPGEQIKFIYFVNSGVVSHVTHLEDGGSIEVGLVGNDGVVGYPIVLGDDISPNHALVQIPDGAMRMDVSTFKEELARGGKFRELVMRSMLVMNKQITQTAACNGSHTVSNRLARWLLMCHDRVLGDELNLTQEFIAQMLGIRRSGVSQAAILLQSVGLIKYSRGHITITDRPGLESVACECYGIVRAEFDRLFS